MTKVTATDNERKMSSQAQSIASPNGRWVLSGPFALIHDRAALLEDLEYAVRPHTAPSVLALFGFKGLRERLETMLEPDGNLVLGRIAECLARSVDTAAVLYEPRRGDFCGLFTGQLDTVASTLAEIAAELDDEMEAVGLVTAVSMVALPGEAHTPVAVLSLADDRRRRTAGGDLRPEPRESVYARIAATLRESDDARSETEHAHTQLVAELLNAIQT
jgi:hypothetical protein